MFNIFKRTNKKEIKPDLIISSSTEILQKRHNEQIKIFDEIEKRISSGDYNISDLQSLLDDLEFRNN